MGFAPGTSPFRCKGVVYKGLLASADERCPGGTAAVMARIEDPALRAFFERPFLAASYYDLLPIVPFGQVAAHIAGMPYLAYVRDGGRWQAQQDVHGIYRVLLHLATPRMVCARLPRLTLQYFDFGRTTGHLVGHDRYESSMSGIPRPILAWLQAALTGFIPVALETAGAKNVVVRILAVVILPIALVIHLAVVPGSHPDGASIRRTSPVAVMPQPTLSVSVPIPVYKYVAISRAPRGHSHHPGRGRCSNPNSDRKVRSEEGSYGQQQTGS